MEIWLDASEIDSPDTPEGVSRVWSGSAPDVAEVALPVLRHRVLTTFNAESAGVTSDDVVRMLVEHVQSAEPVEV